MYDQLPRYALFDDLRTLERREAQAHNPSTVTDVDGDTGVSGLEIPGDEGVTLDPSGLPVPVNLTVDLDVDAGGISATLWWDLDASEAVDQVAGFEAEALGGGQEIDTTCTRAPTTFAGLMAGTEYVFRVRCYDRLGGPVDGETGWAAITATTPGADEIPTTDGEPPAFSPQPVVSGGTRWLHARWEPVPNGDSVVYDVHVVGEPSPESDREPEDGQPPEPAVWTLDTFEPTAATLAYADVGTTSQFIRALPDGTTPTYGVAYHVRIVARDLDGPAPPGLAGTGRCRQLTGDADLLAESITADSGVILSLYADAIIGGAITAATVTLGAGGELRAGTAADGVVFDEGGLTLYRGGRPVISLPTAGDAVFEGDIVGSTITGSTLVGVLRSAASGRRVEVRPVPVGTSNPSVEAAHMISLYGSSSLAAALGIYVDDALERLVVRSGSAVTFRNFGESYQDIRVGAIRALGNSEFFGGSVRSQGGGEATLGRRSGNLISGPEDGDNLGFGPGGLQARSSVGTSRTLTLNVYGGPVRVGADGVEVESGSGWLNSAAFFRLMGGSGTVYGRLGLSGIQPYNVHLGPTTSGGVAKGAHLVCQALDPNHADTPEIWSRNSNNDGYRPMRATSFLIASDVALKQDVKPMSPGAVPLEPSTFRLVDEVAEMGADAPVHAGFVAQSLPEQARRADSDGTEGYDLSAVVAVLAENINTLRARLDVMGVP